MHRIRRLGQVARRGGALLRNRLDRRSFAARCNDDPAALDAPVALYFADGPENLYQLHQWDRVLAALPWPVVVIAARPDTGRRVLDETSLPVFFAPGSSYLEALVARGRLQVVAYVNHLPLNFRMLRFASPVHVHLGHGESDKDSSVTNQNKAYDRVLVAGAAARARIAGALREFDAAAHVREVGRPQLDLDYPGAPGWPDDGRTRVLYAPTWEGDRASMAYGSVASHGVALVRSLVDDPRYRVIYRPHPRTGVQDPSYAAADRRIRALLAERGSDHLVDTGPYGWQWAFADVCVTDLSSVAYDWLATGKPMLVTVPTEARTTLPPSLFLDEVPRLEAADAPHAAAILDRPWPRERMRELSEAYFGDTAPGASTARFVAALDEAIRLASVPVGPTSAAGPADED
ncbi:CDP-glycerol glycerophosphotransferase family protein [Mumia sp. ZJ1417]|uniref:CDP-glycerol glycerophosphotransferase family protein n=1 Tax=Mumia sp. ZJ1417 TaxID=2708082 RepID=UPI001422CEEF|nr:CDP-glycerol glycerophosphotransferase family protein [Mumia sp. ZJ1417]QMW67560.1 CDP-glycerol glycerophosphotransferase family protein [Mumia sp. ZJ1417]